MYSRTREEIPTYRSGSRVSNNRIRYNRGRAARYGTPTAGWLNRTYRRYVTENEVVSQDVEPQNVEPISAIDTVDKPDSSEESGQDLVPITPAPKASEEELVEAINVKSVELNVEENTKGHHTEDYRETKLRFRRGKTQPQQLIIRRGDEFEIDVKFDREYDSDKHDLVFIFKTGDNPIPKSRTYASCTLGEDNYKPDSWGIRIVKTTGTKLTLAVFTPADCVIGYWQLVIKTLVNGADGKQTSFRYDLPIKFVVLLNPWCKEDAVYLPTEKLLNEYILNDGGALFYGNYRQVSSRGWNFGQFSEGILKTSLDLLSKGFGDKIDGNMRDPVFISRAFSKMVNNNDDNGVLVGNWSGKYDDGTRPTAWAGSVKILEQYAKTKTPVQYGQCWVFSGVLTTVCRAVGLPCRSVTNFASAHDTDMSCTIDKVFTLDEDGDVIQISHKSSDSIWNFHVWNEVWMNRKDLPHGHDGWQVIDATPQELSDGVYCLGPAPITAVRNGEINIGYDTGFVCAEVNADEIDWFTEDVDDYYVLAVKKQKVGKKISTKEPTGFGYRGNLSVRGKDVMDREDLTLSYKFAEGTKEERQAVHTATKLANSNRNPNVPDSAIQLEIEEKDDIMVGEDFTYCVKAKNTGTTPRIIKMSLLITTTTYDGETISKVASAHYDETPIEGSEVKEYSVHCAADVYLKNSIDHFNMKVLAFCIVVDEKRAHIEHEDFRLRRPDIQLLDPPMECKADETLTIKLFFENPLNKPLTKCQLFVEGSLELTDDNDINSNGNISVPDVAAKSEWETKIVVKPVEKAERVDNTERDLVLSFDCDELPDIVGFHVVNIVK